MGANLFIKNGGGGGGGVYERRNACCVNICQGHLREKCWKNVIFHTYISGGEGTRKMSGVGNIIAKERRRCQWETAYCLLARLLKLGMLLQLPSV